MSRAKMPINPEVLKWARESIGYSIENAAKKLSVDVNKLELWEKGEDYPTYGQLKKISNAYKRISAVFFLPKPPKDHKLPKDFRILNEADVIKLDPSTIIEIRDAQRKREDALYLAEILDEKVSGFSHKTTLRANTNNLAKKFREIFGLTPAKHKSLTNEHSSLNFWKSAIEDTGVLVFQASLKSVEEMRGLAIFYDKFPLILLNTKDTPKARTFSLLHEYCHLLLHKSGIGNIKANIGKQGFYNEIEVFCNKFAAECLIPQDFFLNESIVQKIKRGYELSNEDIRKLSNRYHVSWEVVLRRLLDFDKITSTYYKSYRKKSSAYFQSQEKLKKESKGPPYHVRVQAYNGEPFTQLALQSYSNGKITDVDLSRYLGMKLNSIEKLTPFVGGYRERNHEG